MLSHSNSPKFLSEVFNGIVLGMVRNNRRAHKVGVVLMKCHYNDLASNETEFRDEGLYAFSNW